MRVEHSARPAVGREWRPLGQLLGGAFHDDPVWEWVVPDPARRARFLGNAFAQLLRRRTGRGTVWTTSDLGGAAMWAEPDDWKESPGEMLRMLPWMTAAIGLRRAPSRATALSAMERHHPKEPHWYLAILGADATRRGQGIGSALLQPVLQRCDEQGMPAYLESSKESNLAFYHRHGFEVTGRIELASDCPPVWPMWRTPR